MHDSTLSVALVYQTDPDGVSTGGIDSFIRGELEWAPAFVSYTVIGTTTDAVARPVGQLHTLAVGGGRHALLPIVRQSTSQIQSRVPLSLRFSFALWKRGALTGFEAIEFHRIEPMLLAVPHSAQCLSIVHHYPPDVRNRDSDNRWRFIPGTYLHLDRTVSARASRVLCVRKSAVDYYRTFGALGDRVSEIDTWADPRVFFPARDLAQMREERAQLCASLGLDAERPIIVTVGRIDHSKRPAVLIDAVAKLPDVPTNLIWIGDGKLRREARARCDAVGIGARARFVGTKTPDEVAQFLRVADLFAFASTYDAKPIAIAEALMCGLPVVSVDVGDIRSMVPVPECGQISRTPDAEGLAVALRDCLQRIDGFDRIEIARAGSRFSPARCLAPLHDYLLSLRARRCT